MERQRIRNNLKRFRREKGLKQTEVAQILELTSSSPVSRWERGICLPETTNVLKMAVLYRSSVDAIYPELRLGLEEKIRQREESVCQRP